jgi:hypothetical protein
MQTGRFRRTPVGLSSNAKSSYNDELHTDTVYGQGF